MTLYLVFQPEALNLQVVLVDVLVQLSAPDFLDDALVLFSAYVQVGCMHLQVPHRSGLSNCHASLKRKNHWRPLSGFGHTGTDGKTRFGGQGRARIVWERGSLVTASDPLPFLIVL